MSGKLLRIAADILREKISVSTKGLKTVEKSDWIFEIHAIEWEQDCFCKGKPGKDSFRNSLIRGRKSDMKETNGGINHEQNRGNDRES